MNDDHFTLSDLFHWVVDQFVFANEPILQSKLPPIESKDGLESTVESRREEARQVDAQKQSGPPKKLSSVSSKALDKEFWEAF